MLPVVRWRGLVREQPDGCLLNSPNDRDAASNTDACACCRNVLIKPQRAEGPCVRDKNTGLRHGERRAMSLPFREAFRSGVEELC